MPIYEFKCRKCGKITEMILSSGNIDKKFYCPTCDSEMDHILSVMSAPRWGEGVRNF
jgi:putative FmdB family regulatory protein